MYWQHDRVYVPRGYKPHANFPRLIMRTNLNAVDEPATYSLILRRHIEDSGVDVVEETPVTDYVNTVNIILQLGFKPAGEVARRRQTLTTEKGITIHLDSIDGKDEAYVKFEAPLVEGASVQATQASLEDIITLFNKIEQENTPYFELKQ